MLSILKKLVIWNTIILMSVSVSGQTSMERLNALEKKVAEAEKKGDYKSAISVLKELKEFSLNNPNMIYRLAVASLKAGDSKKAVGYLNELLKMKAAVCRTLKTDKNFSSIKDDPAFIGLCKDIKKKVVPAGSSTTAYIHKEKDLMVEGVAWDILKKTLFLSSLHRRKIVAVDSKGSARNFVKEKADGLLQVVGMEVDPQRRHLWVCSGYWGSMTILDLKKTRDLRTGVFKYDVDTGKLIKVWYTADKKKRFFNDVTVSSSGDVYLTDTMGGAVFRIKAEDQKLKEFPVGKDFCYPNGITISDDNKVLFVGDHQGMHRIDLSTGSSERVKHSAEVSLVGVDGLAFYNDSLIAHQRRCTGGVVRYYLDKDYRKVVRKKELEVFNPYFDFPTTGEVAEGKYYYIANAQIQTIDKEGELLKDKLKKPRIMVLDLDK